MSAFEGLAGQITVTAEYDGFQITQVSVHSTRPKLVSRILEGKSPEEVMTIVPLLYSLCSTAQTVACVTAIESNQGHQANSDVLRVRNFLLLAETVKELGLRLVQDWLPDEKVISAPALLKWYSQVQKKFSWSLQLQAQVEDSQRIERDIQFSVSELKALLQNLTAGNELSFKESVYAENRYHPVGNAVARLNQKFEGIHLGESAKPLELPEQGASTDYLKQKLCEDETFCSAPDILGDCAESSVWIRNRQQSMVTEAKALNMHPIALRFLALVLELKGMPQRLLYASKEKLINVLAPGFVAVNIARGTLIHNITLEGDELAHSRVASYKVIAPTEWNFHPQGSLVQMLQGVVVSENLVKPLVEKLILAVDPCVAYQVEVIKK